MQALWVQELLQMGDIDRNSSFVYPPMMLRSGQTWYEVFHVTNEDDGFVEKTGHPR